MAEENISSYPPEIAIEGLFSGLDMTKDLSSNLQVMVIQDLLKNVQTHPKVKEYIEQLLPDIGSLKIGEVKWEFKPPQTGTQKDYSIQQLYDIMHPPKK